MGPANENGMHTITIKESQYDDTRHYLHHRSKPLISLFHWNGHLLRNSSKKV